MVYDYSEFKGGEQPADLLPRISAVALQQQRAEADVAELEQKLELAKENLRRISEVTLPELMEQAGQEHLRTTDGLVVDLEEKIFASPSKADKVLAFNWLEKNGHGQVIKRQLLVDFGKGEEEKAADMAKRISEEDNLPVDISKSVHSSTLAALVRELLANGDEVPMDMLGVHRRRGTRVTVK